MISDIVVSIKSNTAIGSLFSLSLKTHLEITVNHLAKLTHFLHLATKLVSYYLNYVHHCFKIAKA